MATIRRQVVKVGMFVVTVAAILVAALFVIGGLRLGRSVHTYHVVTDEAVSGIDINSNVTLRGVAIGKVKAINLDPRSFARVMIDLEIEPSVKIPVGSMAYFERLGLTGERIINISGGTLADGQLAPGSTIPRGETDFDRLAARADAVSDDLATLVADMSSTVREIEAIVAAVDPKRVTAIVEAIEPERVESIVVHTERSSKHLERAVAEARGDLDELTQHVDNVASEAATVLEHADAILQANKADLRLALQNLRRASQDAKALMEELRERPSLLLRSPKQGKKRKHRRRRSLRSAELGPDLHQDEVGIGFQVALGQEALGLAGAVESPNFGTQRRIGDLGRDVGMLDSGIDLAIHGDP